MKKILVVAFIIIIGFVFIFINLANKNMPKKIRPAQVAGQFYNANENELRNEIENYLEKAQVEIESNKKAKAIIVPHAGYAFSTDVAAHSYKTLVGQNIKRVFLLGNSHSAYFNGLAIDDSDVWQTPLGEVKIDLDTARKLVESSDKINFDSSAHEGDHILEVQIPFLQTILKEDFKIIPIVFGNKDKQDYRELTQILKNILNNNDLIVVSSDLSHYPNYTDANTIDQESLDIIQTKNISNLEEHITNTENKKISGEETLMCGSDAIKTIMELSNLLNWEGKIIKYSNSGDVTFGDKDRVVGYGSVVFLEDIKNNELSQEQKNELLTIAKNSIEGYIKNGRIPDFKIKDPRLEEREGAFVTLHNNSQLRGCIGQIIPNQKPLWQVVRDMAIAASTQDNRFPIVNKKELTELEYEISVLSRPVEIKNWQDIELGKHGVIVERGLQGGVFLPQVATETGWTLEEFLDRLCEDKAELEAGCYKNDKEVTLKTFSAQVFK